MRLHAAGSPDVRASSLDHPTQEITTMPSRLTGLIAASVTPMHTDGRVNLPQIGPSVDFLITEGVAGLYVCGSTGEGMSLTTAERRAVAKAHVDAAQGRVPVVVQVGHNSLEESRALATHAQQIGADAVSAAAPFYYPINSVSLLVDSAAHVAAGAPDLPFYYYHIPGLTGVCLDMTELLEMGAERIPNLAGLKYTAPTFAELQACVELEQGRFDVLLGCDEMLLSGLVVGARGAVGSTYNIAAALYRRIFDTLAGGRLDEARAWQYRAVQMVDTLKSYPFLPALKAVLAIRGLDPGPCRLPLPPLPADRIATLRDDLEAIGFFEWCGDRAP
jgi:N-acetylneuraminate lyase